MECLSVARIIATTTTVILHTGVVVLKHAGKTKRLSF